MQSIRAHRHIGLLAAVAVLAAAATPAFAVDNADGTSAKGKKVTAAQHKAKPQKPREDSLMNKDTTPPNAQPNPYSSGY